MRWLAVFPEHAPASDRRHASTRLRATRLWIGRGEAKRVGTRFGTGGFEASRDSTAYRPDAKSPGGQKVSAPYALSRATTQTAPDNAGRVVFWRWAVGGDGRRRLALVRRVFAGIDAIAHRASSHGPRNVGLHIPSRVSCAMDPPIASHAFDPQSADRTRCTRDGRKRGGAERVFRRSGRESERAYRRRAVVRRGVDPRSTRGGRFQAVGSGDSCHVA